MSLNDVDAIYGVDDSFDPNTLNVGDIVIVTGHDKCIVDHFHRGKVYLKRMDNGKALPCPFAYPHFVTLGTTKKVKEN